MSATLAAVWLVAAVGAISFGERGATLPVVVYGDEATAPQAGAATPSVLVDVVSGPQAAAGGVVRDVVSGPN